MIPQLPVDAIREAVAAGDWEAAAALMADHEAQLRVAFAGDSPAEAGRHGAWLELLSAQRGLVEELRQARDEAGAALERIGHDRRGVHAYLKNAG